MQATSISTELLNQRARALMNYEDLEPSVSGATSIREISNELRKMEPEKRRILMQMNHENLDDTVRNGPVLFRTLTSVVRRRRRSCVTLPAGGPAGRVDGRAANAARRASTVTPR